MLAFASIQNTTKLQGLPLCAALNDFPAYVARFVVSPRLDPRFRGDETCWKAEMKQLFRGVGKAFESRHETLSQRNVSRRNRRRNETEISLAKGKTSLAN